MIKKTKQPKFKNCHSCNLPIDHNEYHVFQDPKDPKAKKLYFCKYTKTGHPLTCLKDWFFNGSHNDNYKNNIGSQKIVFKYQH